MPPWFGTSGRRHGCTPVFAVKTDRVGDEEQQEGKASEGRENRLRAFSCCPWCLGPRFLILVGNPGRNLAKSGSFVHLST